MFVNVLLEVNDNARTQYIATLFEYFSVDRHKAHFERSNTKADNMIHLEFTISTIFPFSQLSICFEEPKTIEYLSLKSFLFLVFNSYHFE